MQPIIAVATDEQLGHAYKKHENMIVRSEKKEKLAEKKWVEEKARLQEEAAVNPGGTGNTSDDHSRPNLWRFWCKSHNWLHGIYTRLM
jgi:hypothetical protein